MPQVPPSIEVAGDHFILAIPNPGGAVHHVKFPIDRARSMASFLSSRQRAVGPQPIGTDAAPIQYMVDAWLLEDRQRTEMAAEAARQKLMDDLGISAEAVDNLIEW